MELHWRGQLTERDVRRAYRLYYRMAQIPWGLKAFLLLPLVVAIFVWFSGGVQQPVEIAELIADVWPALLVFALLAAAAFLPLWLSLFSAAATSRTNPKMHRPMEGVITPGGLTCKTAQSEEDLDWRVFRQYRRSDDIVVLYESPIALRMFPRSFFQTDGDWQAFNSLVAQNVSLAPKEPAQQSRRVSRPTRVFVVLLVIVAIVAFLVNLGDGIWW